MNHDPHEILQAHDAASFFREHPEVLILDVRTLEEWDDGHIPTALHIDIQELHMRWQELPEDRDTEIVCICAMGGRSAAACDFLAAQGYRRLTNVIGGMMGYTGETTRGT